MLPLLEFMSKVAFIPFLTIKSVAFIAELFVDSEPPAAEVSVQKSESGEPMISEHDNLPERLFAKMALAVMLPNNVRFWVTLKYRA